MGKLRKIGGRARCLERCLEQCLEWRFELMELVLGQCGKCGKGRSFEHWAEKVRKDRLLWGFAGVLVRL